MRKKASAAISDEEYFQRLKARTLVNERGCWIWQGFRHPAPRTYGEMSYRGNGWRTHRLAWTLAKGKIPPGMAVCHKCDDPGCCNPDHLWLGTHTDNMKDCKAKKRNRTTTQTHCKNGHEFTAENTWRCKDGFRHCLACYRVRSRKKAGWPAEAVDSTPPVPRGVTLHNGKWRPRARKGKQSSTVSGSTD